MRYRADISGLRALAVVPVVLYHADSRLMPGGFVGVDIFFVISGYLITSILAADLNRDDFSLLRFYDRRVRRILPAYVVMAVTTGIAVLVLLPPDMVIRFGASLAAASTFLANEHFLAVASYFAPGVDEQLLLHTWSLAVEEQFYLVWPLALLVLAHPRLGRARPYIIFGLLAVSLVVASRWAILRPERAFYRSIPRAWELLLGAVLALGLLPRLPGQKWAEALAGLGLAMILTAVVFFNGAMTFPGLTALVPTLGALFLIWAGEEGRSTFVGRLISFGPWAGIGLISYSLYLWHWPILALAKLTYVFEPGPLALAALVAASFAVAFLSWRYVETPWRRLGPASRRSEWVSIAVGLSCLALLTGAGHLLKNAQGFPGRASASAREAQAAIADSWPHTARCLMGPNLWMPLKDCRFGDPRPEAPLVALLGDSFANHHAPALDQVTRAEGFGLMEIAKAGCAPGAPLPDSELPATKEAGACNRFRAEALKMILADERIKVVVMAGAWPGGEAFVPTMAPIVAAVDALTAAGKDVILVTPAVAFANGGGRCVLRQRFLHLPDTQCDIPAEVAARQLAPMEAALARLAEGNKKVRLLRLRPDFCDAERCSPLIGGRIALTDSGHLNVEGSMHFTAAFAAALRGLAVGAPAAAPAPAATAPLDLSPPAPPR